MHKISGIVMASGFSKRMGTNKLFLKYNGKTFLQRTLDLLDQAPVWERILVISPENQCQVNVAKHWKIVINQEAEKGQSASVRLGTKAACGEGFLYLTIDQPLLTTALLDTLFLFYTKETIVFPVTDGGVPSSPMFFGNLFRQELLSVSGKAGGRAVRNRHPEAWCKVPVKQAQQLIDIDSPKAYEQLLRYQTRG